ncbi:hypothetical protein, partial [Mucilaginibacter limnophilus]|uniref:hypothetical protein n=1 Tax=Mucilaginibacter limnophilus TaxID=1932778 RepID=UPI00197B8699
MERICIEIAITVSCRVGLQCSVSNGFAPYCALVDVTFSFAGKDFYDKSKIKLLFLNDRFCC